MLHPDGQYEPELIPRLVEPILEGRADLVLGSRFAEPGQAIRDGMPRWKFVANRAPDEHRERRYGHQPDGAPHRVPGLLDASCC